MGAALASPGADVFLSYKAEDQARLQPLVAALEAEGFSIWWDAHIGGGANWREEIQAQLEAAKCVIVAWSKHSVGREGNFVRDEAAQAQRRDVYCPIRLDVVQPPLGFGEVQALSLKGWRGDRSDPRYRALVAAVQSRVTGQVIAHPYVERDPSRISRRAMIGGSAGAAALAAGGGWLLLKPGSAGKKRIAVLPFLNLSNDAQQKYFADGLAEQLRGALSRIGLQVIGRTSSEAVANEDSATIARKLSVSHILTGSVRRSPNSIRIGSQLVDGKTGVETWTRTYDRAPSDLTAVQTDIAEQIARSLSWTIDAQTRKAIYLGGSRDPIAQDYFLQAAESSQAEGQSEAGLRSQIALLSRAIERDPRFARAWIFRGQATEILAISYPPSRQGMETLFSQAERDIRQGLRIAPGLGYGHAELASLAMARLRFREALIGGRRALSLSPNDAPVLISLCNFMPWLGPPATAIEIAKRLVSLDPLLPVAHGQLSTAFFAAARYPEAIAAAERAVELSPGNVSELTSLAFNYLADDQVDSAERVARRLPAGFLFRTIVEGLIAARRGQRAVQAERVDSIRRQLGDLASFQYAEIAAQSGDADGAFDALDTAIRVRDPGLQQTMRDPFLAPLHKDARFGVMLKRLDFPIIDRRSLN